LRARWVGLPAAEARFVRLLRGADVRLRLVAVLACWPLVGCGMPLWNPPLAMPDTPAPSGPAAYAVYSALLDSLNGYRGGLMIAVHAFVLPDTFVQRTAPPAYRDIRAPSDTVPGWTRLARQFTTRLPVYIVPFPLRHCPYPGADGVYSLSRVSFNLDTTHAYVRVTWCCGDRADQSASFYLARKRGRGWAVDRSTPRWVS